MNCREVLHGDESSSLLNSPHVPPTPSMSWTRPEPACCASSGRVPSFEPVSWTSRVPWSLSFTSIIPPRGFCFLTRASLGSSLCWMKAWWLLFCFVRAEGDGEQLVGGEEKLCLSSSWAAATDRRADYTGEDRRLEQVMWCLFLLTVVLFSFTDGSRSRTRRKASSFRKPSNNRAKPSRGLTEVRPELEDVLLCFWRCSLCQNYKCIQLLTFTVW